MQTKKLSTYRMTHFNGDSEAINAESLEQALQYMETTEEESPVVSAVRTATDIATVVQDDPKPVIMTVVTNDVSPANVATPSSANVHAGDQITLKAIPAKNYKLKAWKRNNEVISTEASFVFLVPDVEDEAIVIQAVFELADVAWTTEVEPAEATGDGCLAFPASGMTSANEELELLAVAKGDYTFDHWERNGVSVGTNELLQTTATPLAEGEETEAVYKAVFVQS